MLKVRLTKFDAFCFLFSFIGLWIIIHYRGQDFSVFTGLISSAMAIVIKKSFECGILIAEHLYSKSKP
jgi:hypothetical protein